MEVIFTCFLLIISATQVFSLRMAPHTNILPQGYRQPPKIWLSSYAFQDYLIYTDADPRFRDKIFLETDYVVKNGSDYTVFGTVNTVIFVCRANYPIKWTFPFPKQAIAIDGKDIVTELLRTSDFSGLHAEPKNLLCISVLMMTTEKFKFFNANVTCQSVDAQRQSSIHVFVKGETDIEWKGKTLTVPISPKQTEFVFPCRPATPDLSVILEKQIIASDNKNTSWKKVVENQSQNVRQALSFNPKVGFTVDKQLFREQVFGMYRCKIDKDKEDSKDEIVDEKASFVYLNVTSSTSDKAGMETFESHFWKNGNASILTNIESIYGEKLKCCTGNKSGMLRVVVEDCESPMQCEMMKQILLERFKAGSDLESEYFLGDHRSSYDGFVENDECYSQYLPEGSSIMFCKASDLEYMEEMGLIFRSNMWKLEERIKEFDRQLPRLDKDFLLRTTASNISHLPVDRKALISVGRVSKYPSFYDPSFCFRSIDITQFEKFRPWEYYAITREININEFDRNFYYEGEQVVFMCFSLSNFYSYGTQFRLNWRNGTRTVLEPEYETSAVVHFSGVQHLKQVVRSLNRGIAKPVTVSSEMKSLDCFLPVWNTVEWQVLTYKLEVRAPTLPVFDGGDVKTVFVYLNETDKEIEFHVTGGAPHPKFHLYKDEKFVLTWDVDHMMEWGEKEYNFTSYRDEMNVSVFLNCTSGDSIIVISLPVVTHDIQGDYRCIGTNVGVNVTQTIRVVIRDEDESSYSHSEVIVCAVCVMLGVFLVGFGFWYKCQRRKVEDLRYGVSRM